MYQAVFVAQYLNRHPGNKFLAAVEDLYIKPTEFGFPIIENVVVKAQTVEITFHHPTKPAGTMSMVTVNKDALITFMTDYET